MTDQATVSWLRTQAFTVLAELMTSDDDRIALRAAQIVINSLNRGEGKRNDEKEKRIAIRYRDQGADSTCRPAGDPEQLGALSGSGLRAALGQDRNRQNGGA
jgi:hypothetical protein